MSRCRFISGCPVCGNRALIHWQHTDCSSEEEIDENGDIHCLKCKTNLGFRMDLNFKCSQHDSRPVRDATCVFQALTILMTDYQKNIPADFVKSIGIKILNRLNK